MKSQSYQTITSVGFDNHAIPFVVFNKICTYTEHNDAVTYEKILL